ncbi:MAG: TIGR00725 family protein [Acidobacteriota bacterium]|nr:TIGR00725 family protein [Acidobacteriota bacterium]
MDWRSRPRIGVIGGARPKPAFEAQALEVGRLIAEAGAILVCGGLSGVMTAAARGAREAGGLTIGILPGAAPGDANPYIDVAIATGLGYTRNALVVMNTDAVIAVDGEFGTLSEIAYGNIFSKPVVGLGTWEVKGVTPAKTPEEAVRLALKLAGRETAPRPGRK